MTASIRNHLPTSSPAPKRRVRRAVAATALAAAAVITITTLQTTPASAHCDSRQGPVASAAREALDTGDVNEVLPYVKADQEEELTTAFQQAQAIRRRGPEVQALADEYFQETAVRLHRVGEGASYTGLKDSVEENPALDAAEASLENGSPDEVIDLLDETLQADVSERFDGVLEARAAEAAGKTVETSRERVEAELMFEKYILEIAAAIEGEAAHDAETGGAEQH